MGRGHLSLDEQLAPGGTDADESRGTGFRLNERGAGSDGTGSGWLDGWKRNGGLLACQRTPRLRDPGWYTRADKCVIGGR
jgi:hypothetical protein